MLSRRDVVVGGVLAGISGIVRDWVAHATASQPSTKVSFDVPPNATDCAVHVYEPTRFPYWEGRSYTPEPATLDELRQVLRTLKIERVVVVQATSYGTDNACVVASLRARAASRLSTRKRRNRRSTRCTKRAFEASG